jgi:hypothetical protein
MKIAAICAVTFGTGLTLQYPNSGEWMIWASSSQLEQQLLAVRIILANRNHKGPSCPRHRPVNRSSATRMKEGRHVTVQNPQSTSCPQFPQTETPQTPWL